MSAASSSRVRSNAARKLWTQRLTRFYSGSHNVAAFCASEAVSESAFYSWRRRLAHLVPKPDSDAPALVPLRITPSPAAGIELTLPSGAILRFPADISPQLLVLVLRGLETPSC